MDSHLDSEMSYTWVKKWDKLCAMQRIMIVTNKQETRLKTWYFYLFNIFTYLIILTVMKINILPIFKKNVKEQWRKGLGR